MRQFTANKNDNGVRLSRFVERVTTGLTTGAMYKAFRNKRIKVNGKKTTPDYRLVENDMVEMYINDEFFANSKRQTTQRSSAPVLVEWQDDNIALLFKPAGVLCHSDNTKDSTLASAFCAYLQERGEHIPEKANGFTPALCNRLDRGTEGLIIGAKTYPALRDMNALLRTELVQKYYLCVTVGVPQPGIYSGFLTRDKAGKNSIVTGAEVNGSKPIKTGIEVMETCGNLALCKIALYTGRTHQIRAHLAFLNTPVLGDRRYGLLAANRRYHTNTQLLCAWELQLAPQLPESALQYLQGESFTASRATVLSWWANHTKSNISADKQGLFEA